MPALFIEGLDEIRERMKRFPDKYRTVMHKTMDRVLLHIAESVPEYPPPPPDSDYRRTEQLGRSLGAGSGKADIYEVKEMGEGMAAEFGTNLEYAHYVIGDYDTEQAWMHRGRWWTLPQDVLNRSMEGITEAFQELADKLAAWLDRGVE